MNMHYFKCHLVDELEGAVDYLKSAIELKGSKSEWSKMFYEMGLAEMDHANNFHKMGEEHYKSVAGAYKEVPAYVVACHDIFDSTYNEMSKEFLSLKEMYNK